MMSLTFGLFTQVNDSGPQGPLVFLLTWLLQPFQEYFICVKPIVKQQWVKSELLGKNTLPSIRRTWLSHICLYLLDKSRTITLEQRA